MKRLIAAIVAITIVIVPLSGLAMNIPGYEGGIQNEIVYKEVIFVTGEPVTMEGTLSIKTKEKDNIVTESYNYKLENKAKDAKLSRTITLKNVLEPKGNQVKSTKSLEKYKETIDIDNKRYEAKDNFYQWSQGGIEHNTPLLGYYTGHYSARKTYDVDRGNEELTVDTIGNLVGYDGPWSSTETQTIEYILNWRDRVGGEELQGTATVETSYNKTKDFIYESNTPKQISFSGSYIVTEKEDNVLKYEYDLPKQMEGEKKKSRNQGSDKLSLDTNPKIQSLNIPAVRDVAGHQYEDELLLMASMEGLPLESRLIGPSSEISRGDFARIIIKAMDVPIVKEEVKRSRGRKKVEVVPPLFKDVQASHRNFDYIEEVAKRGIMVGVESPNFAPDEPLTRMEAYTIVVRILGFKNLAPMNMNYSLGYKDENKVQAWAKDSIYVAKELGFIEASDYLYPNRDLTKGEAAKLMVNLIQYMQDDLRYDYMEGILNN